MNETNENPTHLSVAAVNRALMTAFARGDAAGAAAFYTADGQILPPNSGTLTGPAALQAFWQKVMDLGVKSVTLETIEIEPCGQGAHEVGRYTLRGPDSQVLDQGKYIVIWRNENGAWKLHRDIWNSSQPPATP